MKNEQYSQAVKDAILELDGDKYNKLTADNRFERLKEIANSLSADMKGEISVFYSGISEEFVDKIVDIPNVRSINNTDVGQFLKSKKFQTALANIIGMNRDDLLNNQITQPLVDLYNSKLFNTDTSKGELGFWANASKRFAISTNNKTAAFVGEKAKIEKTFGSIELTKKDNLQLNDKLVKDLKQEAIKENTDINIKVFEYAKNTTNIQMDKLLSNKNIEKSVSQDKATTINKSYLADLVKSLKESGDDKQNKSKDKGASR